MSTFADLGLPRALVSRLAAQGIESPFPIQEACLPDALAGRDVVGRAPTGSGKTLAFGLALLARTSKAEPYSPKGLVLVPTRELAAQVAKELANLTADRGRRIITIYGGTSYKNARRALSMGVDIIVACPGRLEDLLAQDDLDLASVTTVVVDEADRMADMGFAPAVRRLIRATNENRHVMLFSATLADEVRSLVEEFTHNPAVHDVVGSTEPAEVDHFFWLTQREERVSILADLVEEHGRAIIFCRTKFGADRLTHQLEQRGIKAEAIHGDRSQSQREKALAAVINGYAKVLVATDVAARGIHIEALPCVVHYDPPQVAEDYVHRSGRTGRAGETGTVVSLITPDLVGKFKRLQRELGLTPSVTKREAAEAQRLTPVTSEMRPLKGKAVKPQEPVTLETITAMIEAEEAANTSRDRGPRSEGRRDDRPRPRRDDRAGRDRPSNYERRDRPAFDRDRPAFDRDRPRRDDRPVRDRPAFERGDRPAFDRDRPRRDDRPVRDRPAFERGDRPAFDREQRPSTFVRDDRPRRDDRRDDRPVATRGYREDRPARRFDDDRSPRRGAPTATVTFFNDTKGYGFATDGQGREVFIHVSAIAERGVTTLRKGQKVSVDIVEGNKGLEGKNVRFSGRPGDRF